MPVGVNWFTGSACNREHLAPLTVMLWWEVQAMWDQNGGRGPYWFWPNVWCDGVKTDPGFPEVAVDAGLVEYWNEVGFPAGCRKDGDSVACEAVNEPEQK